jgi:hypothetical protein
MLTAKPPGIATGAVVLDTALVALAMTSFMGSPKRKNRLMGGLWLKLESIWPLDG